MAFTIMPDTEDLHYLQSAKLGTDTVANGGNLNNNDIGKPLKLTANSTYTICSDGDQIDAFLMGVNEETVDGWAFGTVQVGGKVRVQLSGSSTIGAVVEAAATAAAKTAETSGYGQVSTHTVVTATRKMWRIIGGASVADGAIVTIEKQ